MHLGGIKPLTLPALTILDRSVLTVESYKLLGTFGYNHLQGSVAGQLHQPYHQRAQHGCTSCTIITTSIIVWASLATKHGHQGVIIRTAERAIGVSCPN